MVGMRALAALSALSAALLLAPTSARAQGREADFLFGLPRGALGVRGGYALASGQGDLFDFLSENLTLQPSDFNAFLFGVDFALTLHSRVDLLVTLEVGRGSADSEYRDYVEDNDLPIQQSSELTSVPFMGNLKLYVAPRGREISRFAFIPAKLRPYVGGGGGFVWYRLEQAGDFVDFRDLTIFTANPQTSGAGLGAQTFAGVDVLVTPRIYATIEARYLWAEATPSGDFVGFDSIDLSGLRMLGGVNLSF